jgi:diphosphomevalonate decarboxylase
MTKPSFLPLKNDKPAQPGISFTEDGIHATLVVRSGLIEACFNTSQPTVIGDTCLRMITGAATAIASPNIALIKYWGNRNHSLRLPANGSISMTLGGLETRTTVSFDDGLSDDQLLLDGAPVQGAALARVSKHLDAIRSMADLRTHARVESASNFPGGAGVASSASAFAALSLAGTAAAGLHLEPKELSRLSRLGSGSACRSIFGGFVIWHASDTDAGSFAEQLAPPDHWDLVDLIAVISREHKRVGSSKGHALAETSPIQSARLDDSPRRLEICRKALLERDFTTLASIVELDSNLMHAVMLTSTPSLMYWLPATLSVMQSVSTWRSEGLDVCYTIDAGPNVHCLCTSPTAVEVKDRLEKLPVVTDILQAHPGCAARLE